VAFGNDATLVSASHDQTIRIWDVETGRERRVLRSHNGNVEDVAVSPDGKTFASAGYDGKVHLASVEESPPPSIVRTDPLDGWALRFSDDGRWLAASVRGGARVFETRTGKVVASHTDLASAKYVWSIRFMPGDDRLIWTTNRNQIETWDWQRAGDGEVPKVLFPESNFGESLDYSSDGRLLVANQTDKIVIRDWPSLSPRVTIECRESDKVVFSSDVRHVFSLHLDGKLKIWEASSGELVQSWPGNHGYIYAIAVSPDGRWLASAGDDNKIRLWNVPDGSLRHEMAGHRSYIPGLAFLPDGTTLASACGDRTVRLWDIRTGEERTVFTTDVWQLKLVAISPDGRTIAATGWGDAIYFWRAGVDGPSYVP
jgi:WD40 repeat protein